ncbi:hypothetical protein [Solirubrum puertoriconensis]|uniref:hypothetical protein n=1 Tax=Solirubrum puertoriconensis TaxID=1751427 RepID=UPI00122E542E|nr:hypothetical protein [Solirubrum puertoriconensis]
MHHRKAVVPEQVCQNGGFSIGATATQKPTNCGAQFGRMFGKAGNIWSFAAPKHALGTLSAFTRVSSMLPGLASSEPLFRAKIGLGMGKKKAAPTQMPPLEQDVPTQIRPASFLFTGSTLVVAEGVAPSQAGIKASRGTSLSTFSAFGLAGLRCSTKFVTPAAFHYHKCKAAA